MNDKLQVLVEKQDIAKENTEMLIKAFGAPFTEVGDILADYQKNEEGDFIATDKAIVVTDENDTASMKKARETRLELKRVRTTVENKRKALKEDSLRTGKAIDSVAKFIRDTIQPVEDYLETQEKYAEIKENERLTALKRERVEKIIPYCDAPHIYQVETMSDEDFDKLFVELKQAHELKVAQAEAYEREQKRIAEERAAEEARIREENEVLRKQAEAREREIAKEREAQEEAHAAELRAVQEAAQQSASDSITNAVNTLERFTSRDINDGSPLIDYKSVIDILNGR